MSNIEKLEGLIAPMDSIQTSVTSQDHSTTFGSLMTSYAWRGATQLVHSLIQQERINASLHASKSGVTNERIHEALLRQEKRQAAAEDLLAWAMAQANPAIAPTVDEVMNLITGDSSFATDETIREETIEQAIKLMGMTRKAATKAMDGVAKDENLANKYRETLERALTVAINASPRQFDVSDREALALANKAADKCSQYAESAQTQFFKVPRRATFRRVRNSPQLEAAANKTALLAVLETLEDWIDVLEKEANAEARFDESQEIKDLSENIIQKLSDGSRFTL